MKRSFVMISLLLLVGVSAALASYPVQNTTMLSNGVEASTTVIMANGMQISRTVFQGPQGTLGEVELSPVQPQAANIEYKTGGQVVKIVRITFRAAFGFEPGQVTCSGSATDVNGNNLAPFNMTIANWEN